MEGDYHVLCILSDCMYYVRKFRLILRERKLAGEGKEEGKEYAVETEQPVTTRECR